MKLKSALLQAAAQRHAEYYLSCLKTAREAFVGGDIEQAFSHFDEHWLQIQQAYVWSSQSALALQQSFPLEGFEILRVRQVASEHLLWLETALEQAAPQAQSLLKALLAHSYTELGRSAEAQALAETALKMAEEQQNITAWLKALTVLGNLAQIRADYTQAQSFYEQALNHASAAGLSTATIYNNLGSLYTAQGLFAEAQLFLEKALNQQKAAANYWAMAGNYNNLGALAFRQGDYESAKTAYEACLELRRRIGDKRGIADVLNNLGAVYASQEAFDAAYTAWRECLALCESQGLRRVMGFVLANLASAAEDLERPRQAYQDYHAAILVLREIENRAVLLYVLSRLAALLLCEEGLNAEISLLLAEAKTLAAGQSLNPHVLLFLLTQAHYAGRTGASLKGAAILGFVLATGNEDPNLLDYLPIVQAALQENLNETEFLRASAGGKEQSLATILADLA